jgi:hypothetical protein
MTMRSSLEDAVLILRKLQTDGARVLFSASFGGIVVSAEGWIADVSEESFRVNDKVGCRAFVDWKRCKLASIEYMEPGKATFADLSGVDLRTLRSVWQFMLGSDDFFLLGEIAPF